MSSSTMQALVTQLTRAFEQDKGARAAQLLAAYATGSTDWARFASFEKDHYTRNLVARNTHFELLVLCWGAGQKSPIHDHQGQRCWMGVLDGKLVETQYRPPRPGASRALEKKHSQVFERGGVAYITDDIALHDIGGFDGSAAVSLHLYAGPIAACRIYDPLTGAVTTKVLEYDTIGGRPGARAST
jgi:cysteine dioxygenase